MTDKISIVIPTYGNLVYTEMCITSLHNVKSASIDQIVVIDNHPDHNTSRWIFEHYPNVEVYCPRENLGVAASWDVGIKLTRNNIVAVINNDTQVIEPNWDEKILVQWSKYPQAAVFCPWPVRDESQHLNSDAEPLKGLNGSFFLIKKDIIEKTDNFITKGQYIDRGYKVAYWEDVDLLTQVRKIGFEGLVTPAIKIIHYENRTAGPLLPSGKTMDNPYWINLQYLDNKYNVHIWDYFKVFMSNVLHETTNKPLL